MSEPRTGPPKGPWHAGVQYDDEFSCPVMDESGREVAEARGQNEEDCAAHARLIAGAPEMYNALVRIRSMALKGRYRALAGVLDTALKSVR
jgi:hypothetical protein